MAEIKFEKSTLKTASKQSVLDLLLNDGHAIPNSCRAGTCQTCIMRAESGNPGADSQAGLKDTLKEQGYFLACRCYPEEDLILSLPGENDLKRSVSIERIERVNPDIMRIFLQPDSDFKYRAGQYLTLWRDEVLGRSYSLASVPDAGEALELHIRRVPGGEMTGWLFDDLKADSKLKIQGPAGDCFYVPGTEEQPLLLVGTGTGLAPLIGIAKDALGNNHQGPIHLFHGALEAQGLYLHEDIKALEAQHENFHYHPCVLRDGPELKSDMSLAAVDESALAVADSFAGWKVFLCGAPELTTKLKKMVFLKGANMGDIYVDAFV